MVAKKIVKLAISVMVTQLVSTLIPLTARVDLNRAVVEAAVRMEAIPVTPSQSTVTAAKVNIPTARKAAAALRENPMAPNQSTVTATTPILTTVIAQPATPRPY